MEDTTQGATQSYIIIILIVIGLILFIFFIVELISIPPPEIEPFVDGSIIRIKSLGNGRYLRPFPCTSLTPDACTVNEICGTGGDESGDLVIADGVLANGSEIEWVVCQFKAAPIKTGVEAPYMIMSRGRDSGIRMYNNYFRTAIGFNYVSTVNVGTSNNCLSYTNLPIECGFDKFFWNFILQENVTSAAGVTVESNLAGIYFIRSLNSNDFTTEFCPANVPEFMYCDGSTPPETNSSPNNAFINCIAPLVRLTDGTTPSTEDPLASINYSFLVEVVGHVGS